MLQGIAGAPLGSNVDPQDLSAPELTIEQLLPSIPTDGGRVGTSGKYPAVQSLQAQHPQLRLLLLERRARQAGIRVPMSSNNTLYFYGLQSAGFLLYSPQRFWL